MKKVRTAYPTYKNRKLGRLQHINIVCNGDLADIGD